MHSINDFIAEFDKHLGVSARWNGFEFIARELFKLDHRIHIIETGTVRTEGNWQGDGQSTRIWNWFAEKKDAHVVSIDIDEKAVALSRLLCPLVQTCFGDSIDWLSGGLDARSTDLLFLDSYDYSSPVAESELHHVGELAACWQWLKSGCLIAVDDCHSDDLGKHILIKAFFERLKTAPVHSGYITVWRKP